MHFIIFSLCTTEGKSDRQRQRDRVSDMERQGTDSRAGAHTHVYKREKKTKF